MRIRRGAVATLAIVSLVAAYIRFGPLPRDLLDDARADSRVVVDRTGAVLYEALSGEGTRAIPLSADDLPPLLIEATLAAEDRRFWSHPGVDPVAMLRALRVNLVERRVVEGGSTISQQVAKLLLNRAFPQRHRGLLAKIEEAVLALRLEHRLTKREILARYLNYAAYGNQIAGAERASRAYFNAPAQMLTPAQAAFLAGLPQRPSRFNPYKSPAFAVSRQRTVLARMHAAGAISDEQLQQARTERLVFAASSRPFHAPHFVEMVLAESAVTGDRRIATTLDLELQRAVEGIIDGHRQELARHGAYNVAVVVLDNASGEWLAWEGSGRYDDEAHGGRLNGPRMARQPGSALKPFTYAVAFEHGFTPAHVLADVPTHFPTANSAVAYSPRNYDGAYRGPLLAREALAGSQNIPAVLLASRVGVPTLLRTLSRAGLTTFDKTAAHYGLGVTLGNAEVRLDELVAAYAAFARGGVWIEPVHVSRPARQRRVVFTPVTAFWITDILSDASAREAVFGRGGHLEFPFPVAVKTGTSQAYHDNWTIGYSRNVTVGVWVGNFNRAPLRNSSGITGAAPMFHAVMLAAERRVGGDVGFRTTPIVARPARLQKTDVCGLSGLKAAAWCPTRKTEWLAFEDADASCDWHRRIDGDVAVVWPMEYRQWALTSAQASSRFAKTVSASRSLSPSSPTASKSAALTILNPPDGATYSIDPTLRREFQALPLRAATPAPGPVEWFVDGTPAGFARAERAVDWPLAPGKHRITARDSTGRTSQSTIEVR